MMYIDKDNYFKIYLRILRTLTVLIPFLLWFVRCIPVWLFFFVIECFFVPTLFVDELEDYRWKIAKTALVHALIALCLCLLFALILVGLIELGIYKTPNLY